jgi:hypothetical protein
MRWRQRSGPFRSALGGFPGKLLALMLVLSGCSGLGSAWAAIMVHEIDEGVLRVEIRSRTQLLIPHAYSTWKPQGDMVLVRARAAGYVGRDRLVPRPAPGSVGRIDIVLDDPHKNVVVMTPIGERLTSAAVDVRQFGFGADVFGVSVLIPARDWPHAHPLRIKIIEGVFGTVINQAPAKLERIDSFIKATLAVERGYLLTCGRTLFVIVDCNGRPIPDSFPVEPGEPDESEESDLRARFDALHELPVGGCREGGRRPAVVPQPSNT